MINLQGPMMFGLVMLAVSASAEHIQTLDKVMDLEQQVIKDAQLSQKKVNQIVSETEKLFEEYKQVNEQVAGLKMYNAQLRKKIDNQQQSLKRLASSMDQAATMERQITPLIQKMLYSLDRFIDLDLPFHLQERKQRINHLFENQTKVGLSISERFRQVLAAYTIEMKYGRTMDTYRQTIDLNGNEKEVNILRIGRIALLFQTQDQQTIGFWDRSQNAWQALTEGYYQRAIAQGIRIVKKRQSLDILTIPMQAAESLK